MKKYADAFLVIIGLLIIVGTVVCYLFYIYSHIAFNNTSTLIVIS